MIKPAARKELRTFRSLATLRALNIIAVGSSLAGAVGVGLAVCAGLIDTDHLALPSACTTVVFGMMWAALLRLRYTIKGTPLRWSWFASAPVAMANAAAACAILFFEVDNSLKSIVAGALTGATWGAGVWIPALITTLLAFGAPIAWAQNRAEKGLAGEERGEVVIGLVSAAISVVSLVLMGTALSPAEHAAEGVLVMTAFSLVGLLAGALATVFAARRALVRRSFVARVEEGAVPGYRVDTSAQGKVLVRVTSMGEGYRVANFEEHLAELDEEGDTRRALLRHQL